MRKLILTAAAIAAAIMAAAAVGTLWLSERGNKLISASVPSVANETFTDGRDGQTYKTVKIGGQTWMAQNLNYQMPSGSWCYDNNADNCKKYGRLYDWKTAATACPAGWKLPDTASWNKLGKAAGGKAGKKLKSKSGWGRNDDDNVGGNGTDVYGFSALPGGRLLGDNFCNVGEIGWWWAKENYAGDVQHRRIYGDDDNLYKGHSGTRVGLSVRCVEDDGSAPSPAQHEIPPIYPFSVITTKSAPPAFAK